VNSDELMNALQEPFDPSEVKWKPAVVSGERCMALGYVDARVIMDRLDDVFGVGGWQTTYNVVHDGVVCKLRVKVGGEWVEHEDVGSFSEQPDDGDKLKAGFSDGLKRVAVHLGIGRYLYRLPRVWVGYDPKKKQITQAPQLPAWALPRPQKPAAKPSNGAPAEPKQAVAPPVSAAEVDALLKTLRDKGRTVPAMMKWLHLPESTAVSELTRLQYDKAANKLAEVSGKIQSSPADQAFAKRGDLPQAKIDELTRVFVAAGGDPDQLNTVVYQKSGGAKEPRYMTMKEADEFIAWIKADQEAQKQEVS
jgi:hypothetical protein